MNGSLALRGDTILVLVEMTSTLWVLSSSGELIDRIPLEHEPLLNTNGVPLHSVRPIRIAVAPDDSFYVASESRRSNGDPDFPGEIWGTLLARYRPGGELIGVRHHSSAGVVNALAISPEGTVVIGFRTFVAAMTSIED